MTTSRNKEFLERLYAQGDDTSWRAAKTIEELERIIDQKSHIIGAYYYALQSMPGFKDESGPSWEDYESNVNRMKVFATVFFDAKADGKVDYDWGVFRMPEKKD